MGTDNSLESCTPFPEAKHEDYDVTKTKFVAIRHLESFHRFILIFGETFNGIYHIDTDSFCSIPSMSIPNVSPSTILVSKSTAHCIQIFAFDDRNLSTIHCLSMSANVLTEASWPQWKSLKPDNALKDLQSHQSRNHKHSYFYHCGYYDESRDAMVLLLSCDCQQIANEYPFCGSFKTVMIEWGLIVYSLRSNSFEGGTYEWDHPLFPNMKPTKMSDHRVALVPVLRDHKPVSGTTNLNVLQKMEKYRKFKH